MNRRGGRGTRGAGGRAQTLLDYLIGITVLLLVVAGTFAVLPGLDAPFDDSIGSEERQMADRLADGAVEWNGSTAGDGVVHHDELVETLETPERFAALNRSVGIPPVRNVNITLESNGERVATGGSSYWGDPAATVVRTVKTHESNTCTPGCRLVVRVW